MTVCKAQRRETTVALRPPSLVVHADWSKSLQKRWYGSAALQPDGRYQAEAPERVGDLKTFFCRLQRRAGADATVLAGFDFPVGLPEAYAREAGFTDFRAALAELGHGRWRSFYDPASTRGDIALTRPFYPRRPGGAKRNHLATGLGVPAFEDLLRRCDRGHGRNAACALFWLVGGSQVGKAAITGWRDLLGPAVTHRSAGAPPVAIWPFDGALDALLDNPGIVVAETYPGEVYRHLVLDIVKPHRSKRKRDDRAADARRMHRWARNNGVRMSSSLHDAIDDGFGEEQSGEDRFDAVVGLLGMLDVVLGNRPPGAPGDERTRVEGWILGQQPVPACLDFAS